MKSLRGHLLHSTHTSLNMSYTPTGSGVPASKPDRDRSRLLSLALSCVPVCAGVCSASLPAGGRLVQMLQTGPELDNGLQWAQVELSCSG